jgi:hypothetical protein
MVFKRISCGFIFLLICFFSLPAQHVKYSPAFFGPNAMPVPEVTNGKIPDYTQFGFSTDYSFGFGDKTLAWRIDSEIPLLPKFVSIKAWMIVHELYWLTPEVRRLREIDTPIMSGWATGDFYAQTRITLLREKKYCPQIIAAVGIKTASGGKFEYRRYFDNPAYFFDVSVAKSFSINTKALNDIRLVADIGFLCWGTTSSSQDDAGMYGLNLIMSNSFFTFENQIAGYWGRLNNGDRPLIYQAKLTYNNKFLDIFFQYQYGIMDFPYHQIRLGFVVPVKVLTPKYSLERKERKNVSQ